MATRKRKTNRKKRQTKRYIGGAQKLCEVCCPDPTKPNPKITCYYHTYKSEGAPTGTLTNGPNYNTNAFYEDHIRTHPICKYCLAQDPLAKETLAQDPLAYRHYDTKALAAHIQNIHPDKYKIAEKIKTNLFDNKNLIAELNSDNTSIIGILPGLDEFYKQIADKETKMAEEEIKKQRQQNAVKPKAKAEANVESAAKAKADAEAKAKAEAEAEAEAELKARIAEEQRIKREEADKRKAEKLAMEAAKAKEQEAIKNAAKAEADRAKKAAKKAAKAEARELAQMGQEEELSKQLHAAQTVDKVIDIINNTLPIPPVEQLMPPLPPMIPPLPPVKIDLKNILKKRKLNDKTDLLYKLKNFTFQLDIHEYILSTFPLISCNTGTMSNKSYYEIVSLIIFITGLLNMLFKVNNIDIKLIIKGGKAAQMMLSTYGYSECDIKSDDIDILLVQENGYDREYLMDFAKQFANLIKYIFDNEPISILNPAADINPNIYKISFSESNEFKPISDIDFKYDDSGFFANDKIMELPLQVNYYGNVFYLLYYLQNPKTFLEEKKHYLAIYENIVQKTHDGKKSCDCNAKITDYDCHVACNYRLVMAEKFKKYIAPFEQLLRPKTPSARRDV